MNDDDEQPSLPPIPPTPLALTPPPPQQERADFTAWYQPPADEPEGVDSADGTGPYREHAAPYGENSAPYGEDSVSFGGRAAPYGGTSAPYGEHSVPYGEEDARPARAGGPQWNAPADEAAGGSWDAPATETTPEWATPSADERGELDELGRLDELDGFAGPEDPIARGSARPRGRSRARKAPTGDGPTVVCPYCLWDLDWDTLPLVYRDGDSITYLERQPGESDARWLTRTSGAERICEGDDGQHYLPADYGEYQPLIIGVVGASASGKTHLLAAMIDQLVGTILLKIKHNLTISPLDSVKHREFVRRKVTPFVEDRKVLPGTQRDEQIEFVYALRAHNNRTGEKHALIFFDVSGEFFNDAYAEYVEDGTNGPEMRELQFISIVDALLFVADAEKLDRHLRLPDKRLADPAFMKPFGHIDRIRNPTSKAFLPLPAALVVAKSDVLHWHPVVQGWLYADDDDNLETVEEESEEAYVFLRSRGAESWLHPVVHCGSSTIHFASASGVPKVNNAAFQEKGFGPRRVLRPLLSLLAMKGVIKDENLGRDDLAEGAS